MKKPIPYAILLLIGILLLGCGNQATVQGGGGTTETVGTIFTKEGTPAAGVTVAFVPRDLNPQSGSAQIDSLYSDHEGHYSIAGIDDGVYNILYGRDSLRALRQAIEIKDGEFQVEVSDTLRETGSIRGVVSLLPEHNNLNIFLLFMGANRFVSPSDESGTFFIDSLAEGTYEVTIITREPNYGHIDTTLYIESSVKAVLPDTIHIPYIGLQTPENVHIAYDTLLQRTTITWSPVESASLGGYQIRRRAINDSDDVTLFRVKTTDFIDTCDGLYVLQNGDYSYDVATVDLDGRCGKPSLPLAMIYTSYFAMSDSVQLGSLKEREYGGIISDGEGTLFAVCSDSALLYILDEDHTLKKIVPIPDEVKPYDIVYMDDGTLMIAGDKGCYNLDREGNMLWRYDVQTPMIDVVDSTVIYYADTSSKFSGLNSIFSLDVLTGAQDTIIFSDKREIKSFCIIDNTIYIAFDFYGYLIIESSPLAVYEPTILFEGGHIRKACDLAINGDTLVILAGRTLGRFHRKTNNKLSQTIVENGRYVTTGTSGNVSVLNDDGILHKLKRKGN